ncbi:MAG: hypothetical protein IT301_15185 [Dehalococcoidia bacterium]|nr:hypothetical protein [Dehalococcoidia bacterium]
MPDAPVTATAYFNGAVREQVSWPFPSSAMGLNFADTLGVAPAPGTLELRVFVGGKLVGTFSAAVSGAVAPPPPPYVPSGGCVARRTNSHWELCVTDSFFETFEVRVTVLSEAATESTFKVRVSCPGWESGDSFTKYPFYVGQTFTFDFPSDFSVYSDCGPGEYEVELRVDYLTELRVYVDVR